MKRKHIVLQGVQKVADVKAPLAEGLIKEPTERRDWKRFSDEELIGYAKKFIEEKRIKNRMGLEKADLGLYRVLLRRNILDQVKFKKEKKQIRTWSAFSDSELVSYTQTFIHEKGIQNRKALQTADCGLYKTLTLRKLLDQFKFKFFFKGLGFHVRC